MFVLFVRTVFTECLWLEQAALICTTGSPAHQDEDLAQMVGLPQAQLDGVLKATSFSSLSGVALGFLLLGTHRALSSMGVMSLGGHLVSWWRRESNSSASTGRPKLASLERLRCADDVLKSRLLVICELGRALIC